MRRIEWFGVLLVALFGQNCLAFVPTVNSAGMPIRWKVPIRFGLFGNPVNQSGLHPEDFFDAVTVGLQRWKYAASGPIDFNYWQGNDPHQYPPNSAFNGTSSIYFASNTKVTKPMSPNVLGMTQVWFNTDTGEILETDIELNDLDFHFTNNPTDTSGFGTGNTSNLNGRNNVFIQNVVTHELGHAFGLSHSGGLQSTMLFMESPEQAHLGCDELIGIHALYPSSDQDRRGGIQGQVVSENGNPVFGAHVLAISQSRGTVLATSLTDQSGKFLLSALEPGTYFILSEPFYAGTSALPTFYGGMSPLICPNDSPFNRSFLMSADQFHLEPIAVSPHQISTAPYLTVHCDSVERPSTFENSLASTLDSALILTPPPTGNPLSTGVVDTIQPSHTNSYRLLGIAGHLEIHSIAYSLYSPIHTSLTLVDKNNVPVVTQIFDPVYRGDSGYINHDSALEAFDLPEGNYTLHVTANSLKVNDYPAGPLSLDSNPFLVITSSLNQPTPQLASAIPTNARCRQFEDFQRYSSPTTVPTHSAPTPSHEGESSSSGGCNTVQRDSNPNKAESTIADKISFLLTWFLMITLGRIAIFLHRQSGTANLKG